MVGRWPPRRSTEAWARRSQRHMRSLRLVEGLRMALENLNRINLTSNLTRNGSQEQGQGPRRDRCHNSLLSWCVAVRSQALTRPGGLNHLHILSTRVEETLLHVLARLGHPNFAEHLSATTHASEVGASLWGVRNPWYVPPPLR